MAIIRTNQYVSKQGIGCNSAYLTLGKSQIVIERDSQGRFVAVANYGIFASQVAYNDGYDALEWVRIMLAMDKTQDPYPALYGVMKQKVVDYVDA